MAWVSPNPSWQWKRLGESPATPGVVHIERLDLDPFIVAPHIRIAVDRCQGKSAGAAASWIKGNQAERFATRRLRVRRVEVRLPRLGQNDDRLKPPLANPE